MFDSSYQTKSLVQNVLHSMWAFIKCLISVEYVRSRRGKLMLKVNGYTYSSTPGVGLKKRWKCSTHQHLGCKGSVHTVNEQVLKVNETHDHPPQKRWNIEVELYFTLSYEHFTVTDCCFILFICYVWFYHNFNRNLV